MTATIRVRLDLAYDGAGFAGWARQPGLRTVEETLGAAIGRITRLDDVRLTVAGRTDAGVHARGQVVHLDLPVAAWERLPGRSQGAPHEALVRRLAGVLPADMSVRRAQVAPPGFDARFAALWRRYRYRIADADECRDPLTRGWVLWHRRPLDEAAMDRASRALIGEHDFAAYCRPREGATTIRTLLDFSWHREETGLVVATVRADAFCHNMVRALVGGALQVGEGRRAESWPMAVLRAGVRDPAVAVMPPHPLVLEEVAYPPAEALADRVREARSRRDEASASRQVDC